MKRFFIILCVLCLTASCGLAEEVCVTAVGSVSEFAAMALPAAVVVAVIVLIVQLIRRRKKER